MEFSPQGENKKPPGRGRTCAARNRTASGCLRESCGPGMPGPYRAVDLFSSRKGENSTIFFIYYLLSFIFIHAPSVAAMTALIVCIRFSAS